MGQFLIFLIFNTVSFKKNLAKYFWESILDEDTTGDDNDYDDI